MFEFHGWDVVKYHSHDTDNVLQDRCWQTVTQRVQAVGPELVRTQRHNGCDSVLVAGQHNHRAEYVIDLFRWIAENAPGPFGTLYVFDDEDSRRSGGYTNEFRVWKLYLGSLSEMEDPFLSPYVPVVADPHDPARQD